MDSNRNISFYTNQYHDYRSMLNEDSRCVVHWVTFILVRGLASSWK
ncbi:hypothetical protein AHF37_08313 [Paragonimus kellicotti]|nr:hypothetical protein AHF37_08313 [Paragonimus kellicotti]